MYVTHVNIKSDNYSSIMNVQCYMCGGESLLAIHKVIEATLSTRCLRTAMKN